MPTLDNSRCKFANGGACCVTHCGDPACLADAASPDLVAARAMFSPWSHRWAPLELQEVAERTFLALRDMEARKDAAYLERNQLVAALAKCFPSGVARTAIEGWSEDWHGCVYIDLPTGQVSWHFHDSQAYLFADLPPYAGAWDGHDTPEKYRRLAALSAPTAQPAPEAPAGERKLFEQAHKAAGYGAIKWNSDGDRPLFQHDAARYVGWQLARAAAPVAQAAPSDRAELAAIAKRGVVNAGDDMTEVEHAAMAAIDRLAAAPMVPNSRDEIDPAAVEKAFYALAEERGWDTTGSDDRDFQEDATEEHWQTWCGAIRWAALAAPATQGTDPLNMPADPPNVRTAWAAFEDGARKCCTHEQFAALVDRLTEATQGTEGAKQREAVSDSVQLPRKVLAPFLKIGRQFERGPGGHLPNDGTGTGALKAKHFWALEDALATPTAQSKGDSQ